MIAALGLSHGTGLESKELSNLIPEAIIKSIEVRARSKWEMIARFRYDSDGAQALHDPKIHYHVTHDSTGSI